MAKKKLTAAQKARETRNKKQLAMMKEMGIDERKPVKKARKPRKPLTPEQRAAAIERLALAREKRLKGKPPAGVHPDVLALPDDHKLNHKEVKQWIKIQKEKLASMRGWQNSKDAKQRQEHMDTSTYLKNLNRWLADAVWLDSYYGEQRSNRVKYIVTAGPPGTVGKIRIGMLDEQSNTES
jgi:hypothetical protein